MKLFVIKNVQDLTDRWHGGGGLVAVCETLEDVPRLHTGGTLTTKELESAVVYELDPTYQDFPHVYVFPDAGCC